MPESLHTDLRNCGSNNHHFFCDIKQWFLRQLVGINVNPYEDDPNELVIEPHFASALNFAEGSYDAPNGSITVKWEKDGENVLLSVKTVGDIKFRIVLDEGYAFANSRRAFLEKAADMEKEVILKTVL